MKKELLIVGITVLLIAVGLSGCTDQKTGNDSDKFVGTWIFNMEIPGDFEGDVTTMSIYYIFNSDGTLTTTAENQPSADGTWKVENGKLIMTSELGDVQSDYSFSDGDKVLTLEMSDMGLSMVLNKQ